MIKRLVQGIVLAGMLVLFLVGCTFAPMSILGTWTMPGVESVEFTLRKYIVTDLSDGSTWECSIDEVDADNNRLRMTTTDTSGSWVGFSPDGQRWYLLWDISGDTMYIGTSTVAYPTTTPYGPYTK
jgi:hypothetical protein